MNAPAHRLTVIAHADVTAGSDTVACPIGNGRLPASACARRHLARDTGTHRHPGERFPAARYPACAACPLGGVAQARLGIPGTPGKAPKAAPSYLFDNDATVVIRRPARVAELPDDFPDVPRLPVQPHPRSATFETWLAEQQPVQREPVVVQRPERVMGDDVGRLGARRASPVVRPVVPPAEKREPFYTAAARLRVSRVDLARRAAYLGLRTSDGMLAAQWDELAEGLDRKSGATL